MAARDRRARLLDRRGCFSMDVVFFESPSALRAWLAEHHATAQELWIGFYKKSAGKASVSYAEAVDQALCFGWIDGIRKSVDPISYTNRFTPRTARSIWSAVNLKRAEELIELGLMQPAGLQAYQTRDPQRSQQYSHEQASHDLDSTYEQQFRANAAAWDFFRSQPPSYQRGAIWRVMSAKKEETRLKRLATLIEDSQQGRTIAPLTRTRKA
jgi:uncharacterized protein YdeI (YjbR/CyaY-like superfamily)